jgi:hypothetical protein
MNISRLSQTEKCNLAIELGERAAKYIDDDAIKRLIADAFNIAKEWNRLEDAGEVLYDFLDNEEHGFTIYQENEEDEIKINAWNCIIDAIAFVSKMAYLESGVKYLPEPIEIVDDDIFDHMINALSLCGDEEREFINKL